MPTKYPAYPGRRTLRTEFYWHGTFLGKGGEDEEKLIAPFCDEMPLTESWQSPWPGLDNPKAKVSRWWLFPNNIVIGEERETRSLIVDHRTPHEDYWVSATDAETQLEQWTETLYQSLLHHWEKVGDCNGSERFICGDGPGEDYESARFPTPADHWEEAKRRYGIKNNPLIRLVYLLGIDPEGRFRYFEQDLPPHLRRLVREADRQVALRLGLNPDEDDLHGTDG